MVFELVGLGLVWWSLSSKKEEPQKTQKVNVNRKTFSGALHEKVLKIANELGIDASLLYAIMNFETAYTLSPQSNNSINCGGLIGFCPVYNQQFTKYIDGSFVGQSGNLLTKDASYQLDYVKKFFQDNIKIYGKPRNKLETYLMVLHPSTLKYVKNPNHIVGSEISMSWAKKVAEQNAKAFLDSNGYVTVKSLAKAVNQFM